MVHVQMGQHDLRNVPLADAKGSKLGTDLFLALNLKLDLP